MFVRMGVHKDVNMCVNMGAWDGILGDDMGFYGKVLDGICWSGINERGDGMVRGWLGDGMVWYVMVM